jgi:molecular chaperone HtpG
MGRIGDGELNTKRIFELNPNHAVVKKLQNLYAANPSDPKVEDTIRLLYDQAVLAEGSKLKDLTGFLRRINELIAPASV